MKETSSRIPFGLIFEEPAGQPHDLIMPVYDEETDLSYVEDAEGCLKNFRPNRFSKPARSLSHFFKAAFVKI